MSSRKPPSQFVVTMLKEAAVNSMIGKSSAKSREARAGMKCTKYKNSFKGKDQGYDSKGNVLKLDLNFNNRTVIIQINITMPAANQQKIFTARKLMKNERHPSEEVARERQGQRRIHSSITYVSDTLASARAARMAARSNRIAPNHPVISPVAEEGSINAERRIAISENKGDSGPEIPSKTRTAKMAIKDNRSSRQDSVFSVVMKKEPVDTEKWDVSTEDGNEVELYIRPQNRAAIRANRPKESISSESVVKKVPLDTEKWHALTTDEKRAVRGLVALKSHRVDNEKWDTLTADERDAVRGLVALKKYGDTWGNKEGSSVQK